MADLTDEQCDDFRRLPGSFNDMVRAIYRAGRESTATPPADAALADALESIALGDAMATKELMRQCAAALRARAMPDVLNDAIGRLLVAADNLSYEPGTVGGIAELQDAADELGRAMLAASKSGDGGAG